MFEEFQKQIDICNEQEEKLQFESFTDEDAWEIGNLMVQNAKENNFPITIDITYKEQVMFHTVVCGAKSGTADWIRRKKNTVEYAKKSSLNYCLGFKQQGKTFDDTGLKKDDYVFCGGGFPLIVKGEGIVGTFAVSGLVDTQDHQVMIDALTKYLQK